MKRKGSKLRYLPDVERGYTRVKRGRGYYFMDPEGNRVTDTRKLERFRALVIPPAWKNVWISPSKRGHLQATGLDEEGRKQYLYHPDWTTERQRAKLSRMVDFGHALPQIRKHIAKDLRYQVLRKEKVIAIALKVTEETLIRIGNEQYLRKYGSRGLTTLKKKNVDVSDNEAVFRFRGKKGVRQQITVRNARLAAHLLELARLPGAYLFQYLNEDGKRYRLSAADINAYIQRFTNRAFTSKDYRTWYAGLWAFRLFARCLDYGNEKECQANVLSVLDAVSRRLGNTRAVCKQYYVPDSLVSAYTDGSLLPYLNQSLSGSGQPMAKETEKQLLVFLQQATQG
ncbi:DNA topoisomerase IB [Parapedobacter koreensis]|uniref:DNA topoisomerase-1 n=1 Tax=Parapedobacter koreensis TaxID=332977 RepID=A0A1H7NWY7_9SPHI|nr:DNA topoisomerase IB [Parapedobacter koreensis]SEL28093.1 DNA topoisomerase-1 [Parapedobacter koreensis]